MTFFQDFQIHKIIFYKDQIFTTVTKSAPVVDEWISTTLHCNKRRLCKLLVGLDTEWCPPDPTNGHQKVAIIQLCIGRRCLIFQLLHADSIPKSLINFLENKKFAFIGKEVQQDADKLYEDYGLYVGHVNDISHWAAKTCQDSDYRSYGLKALVREFLQEIIPKPKNITMSDWSIEELSEEQIEYACLDAFVSFKVGDYLAKRKDPLQCYEYYHSPKRFVDPWHHNKYVVS